MPNPFNFNMLNILLIFKNRFETINSSLEILTWVVLFCRTSFYMVCEDTLNKDYFKRLINKIISNSFDHFIW